MKENNNSIAPTKDELLMGSKIEYLALTKGTTLFNEGSKALIVSYAKFLPYEDRFLALRGRKKLISSKSYSYFKSRFELLESKFEIKLKRVN